MKIAVVVALGLMLALSACGKKGAPQPPGPADQISYPKAYPAY